MALMRRRPVWLPLLLCLPALLTCGFDEADGFQSNVDVVSRGTSSRAAQRKALTALPLDKLSRIDRAKSQVVLDNVSVFRELPTVQFEVEPEVYSFFANHPDVAVSIWRVMKISQFKMFQTGPHEYEVDGQDGTVGIVEVAYSSPNEHVLLCEGSFKSPVTIRPIKARAIIHMQTEFGTNAEGKSSARHRVCFFASFPSQTVETAARLISPVSNTIVDRNLRETSLFVHMMSVAMSRHPGWVERVADQLDGVLEASKTELLDLTARVYVAEQKRMLAKMGHKEVTLDDVLAPLQVADEPAELNPPEPRTAAESSPMTN